VFYFQGVDIISPYVTMSSRWRPAWKWS